MLISPRFRVILSVKEYGRQQGKKDGEQAIFPAVYICGHQIVFSQEREDILSHQKTEFALAYIEGYEAGRVKGASG
jgi:hypothetical protein